MNVFVASIKEMMDRFDPKFVAFSRRVTTFRYPGVRMLELLSEAPEYGAGEAGVERISPEQPRYVRITDIDENGELTSGLGVTAEDVEDSYFLRDNDMLFARSGNTVGKTYLHDTELVKESCLYAGYMIRFRFNDKVLPKYVFCFSQTPYYHEWTQAVQRSAGQPNINAQEYCRLVIPLPPLPEQQKIVDELDAAYAAKRAADEKAKQLLASIDDMVLKELGIVKLPPPDTSLAARVFTVPLKDVAGGRLDAYSYSPHFARNVQRIREVGACALGKLVRLSHAQWDQKRWNNELTFPYVEIGAIVTEEGKVGELEEVEITAAPSRARMIVHAGDLLVSLTRPTRRAIAFAEQDAVASTGFAVINGFSNDVVPEYLFAVLRSELCTYQFDQRSTGGNYPAMTEDQLLQCEVPVPPKPVQERIAAQASAILSEARKLKSESAAALAAAKRRIESRIIGKRGAT